MYLRKISLAILLNAIVILLTSCRRNIPNDVAGNLCYSASNYAQTNSDSLRILSQRALSLRSDNKDDLALCYKNLGYYYLNQNNLDTALMFFDSALHAVSIDDPIQKAAILISKGYTYHLHGFDISETYSILEQGLECLEAIPQSYQTDSLYTVGYWYLSEVLNAAGQPQNAEDALLKAYNYSNGIHTGRLKININTSLANLRVTRHRYSDAIFIYKASIDSALKQNDRKSLRILYSNLGDTYIQYQQSDSGSATLLDTARKYLEQSLLYVSKNDHAGLAFIYKAFGKLYIDKNMYDSAFYYLGEALRLFTDDSIMYRVAECHYSLGTLYLQRHDGKRALKEYTKAYNIYKNDHEDDDANTSKFAMGLSYEENKEYHKAITAFREYFETKDSLQSHDTINTINGGEIYEALIKDTKSNAEIKAKKIEIQKQRIALYLTAGFTLALLLFVSTLIYGRSIILKKNKDIQQRNAEIQKRNDEIEWQKSEILHNNKAYIMLLIDVFQAQAKDSRYASIANENVGKLESLERLYRMLYENNSDKADLIHYLSEFCALKQKILENNLTMCSQVPSIMLPIDTLIRVSLIINELTTNAIKHASANRTKVSIEIKKGDENLIIIIKDSGKGFAGDFDIEQESKHGGFSLMKRLIVYQFDGSIEWHNIETGGACFVVNLRLSQLNIANEKMDNIIGGR